MRSVALALPVAALMATAAAAEIPKEYRKAIDLHGEVSTSAQTCSEMGFEVDFAGIIQHRRSLEEAAVADGIDQVEIEAAIDESIDLKYKALQRRFRGGSTTQANSERYKGWWSRRCKDLAKNEAIAGLITTQD